MGYVWETYEGSLLGITNYHACFNMVITCKTMFYHVSLVLVGGMEMNGLRVGDV